MTYPKMSINNLNFESEPFIPSPHALLPPNCIFVSPNNITMLSPTVSHLKQQEMIDNGYMQMVSNGCYETGITGPMYAVNYPPFFSQGGSNNNYCNDFQSYQDGSRRWGSGGQSNNYGNSSHHRNNNNNSNDISRVRSVRNSEKPVRKDDVITISKEGNTSSNSPPENAWCIWYSKQKSHVNSSNSVSCNNGTPNSPIVPSNKWGSIRSNTKKTISKKHNETYSSDEDNHCDENFVQQAKYDIMLPIIPTKPLLRTLAKECKPFPPWAINIDGCSFRGKELHSSFSVNDRLTVQNETYPASYCGVPKGRLSCNTLTLSEELTMFADFISLTNKEKNHLEEFKMTCKMCFQKLWGNDCEFVNMGLTAAGVFHHKDSPVHVLATNTASNPIGISEDIPTTEAIRTVLLTVGFSSVFFEDVRGCTTVLINANVPINTPIAVCYGPRAHEAERTAIELRSMIGEKESYRIALIAVDALLRQNNLIDSLGTKPKLVCGEAVAVMLLALVKSYGGSPATIENEKGEEDDLNENDTMPPPGKVLMDFFITYGFPANFDPINHTCDSAKGLTNPVMKIHRNDVLSILDPSSDICDSTRKPRNLATGVDSTTHLTAILQYCYTATQQYEQMPPSKRRAQSVLSTIIGGEAYWGRVIDLYDQRVSPFYEVVLGKMKNLDRVRKY
eukprot:Tbor_TRINITY_DN5382_c2_g1::TRINITY_DN5382_c2_g1_i1::g.4244::m.4244